MSEDKNTIIDETDILKYKNSVDIGRYLYSTHIKGLKTVDDFIREFKEYKSRFHSEDCYPGLYYYKSEKFWPKIRLGGELYNQQVLIANSINKQHVYSPELLTTSCGEKWCCNPKHITTQE